MTYLGLHGSQAVCSGPEAGPGGRGVSRAKAGGRELCGGKTGRVRLHLVGVGRAWAVRAPQRPRPLLALPRLSTKDLARKRQPRLRGGGLGRRDRQAIDCVAP